MKKLFLFTSIFIGVVTPSFSASIYMDAPEKALSNKQPIVIQVFLDQENDIISGVAGGLSFPTDLFSVEDISVEESIVSLWVKQPKISDEKYFDNRTHVTFEGIFPGGYSGVRSPYYSGKKPGRLFYITLVPKNKGSGIIIVDDIELHAFDQEASLLPSTSIFKAISVPDLDDSRTQSLPPSVWILKKKTLDAFVTRDPLVNNNAWYLVVNEREQKSSIKNIYVAENYTYGPELVEDKYWRRVSVPFVLFAQDRSKYVHVKVEYSNNTHTLLSISPVENSESFAVTSRILVSIVVVLSLLYIYAYYLYRILKKKE